MVGREAQARSDFDGQGVRGGALVGPPERVQKIPARAERVGVLAGRARRLVDPDRLVEQVQCPFPVSLVALEPGCSPVGLRGVHAVGVSSGLNGPSARVRTVDSR